MKSRLTPYDQLKGKGEVYFDSFGMWSTDGLTPTEFSALTPRRVRMVVDIEWRSHGLKASVGDIFNCYTIAGKAHILFETQFPWRTTPTRTLCLIEPHEFTDDNR